MTADGPSTTPGSLFTAPRRAIEYGATMDSRLTDKVIEEAYTSLAAAERLLEAAKACLLDVCAVCSQQEAVEVALTRADVPLNVTLAALMEALA